MPERIQDVLLALAFLACGGHHILLRLLSLHLCNEYLSLPKKKKKKKKKKLIGVTAPTSKAVFILLHRAALVQ